MLIDDEPAQKRLVSAIAARCGLAHPVMPRDAETALATLASREGCKRSTPC
jgi:hypothetical protein